MAAGINNLGQVVGSSTVGGTLRAFLWSPGIGMQDLGTIDGLDSARQTGSTTAGKSSGLPGTTTSNIRRSSPCSSTPMPSFTPLRPGCRTWGHFRRYRERGIPHQRRRRTDARDASGNDRQRCWRHKQQRTNRRALRYEPLRRPLPRACSRIRSALGYSSRCPLPGWHRHDKRNSRNDPDTFVFEGSRQHVRPGAMLLSAKACLRRLVNHRHASADRSMAPSVGISKPCHF